MLKGRPGVGKTLMANCFIEATGLKSFVCRKNKSNGEFVDEIKRVFDEAVKAAPAIVFLDDMDKFANEDDMHIDAEEYVTVQSCIDESKGKRVFVIATVNNIDKIPDSLQRVGRFDKTIIVKPPKGEDAKKITEHYLSKVDIIEGLNAETVANLLNGSSCAMLETVINKAGIYAGFYNKAKIDMDDIVKAFLDVKYSITEDSYVNNKEAEVVSIHEAGHTVMAEILVPGSINLVVMDEDFNHRSSGFIHKIWGEFDIEPYKREEYDIMIDLSGKAATEIMLNTIDMGCNDDLKSAFRITEILVDDVCSLGFDTFIRHDSGDDLKNRRDYLISKQVEKYYLETKNILEANKEFISAVSRELLEKRVLLRSDIDRIKSNIGFK